MSDAPKAPAGWYPDESGGQRYWNGHEWTTDVIGGAPRADVAKALVGRRGWGSWPTGAKIGVVAGAAAVVAVGVIGVSTATAASSVSPFEAALDECGLRGGADAQILDDGNGLILDMEGEDSAGLTLNSVACVLNVLDVPDTTVSRMDGTRALDGRQSDEFDGITIEWTYHPDDGMDILLTR